MDTEIVIEGNCKGEKCNRNGCVGIIDEHIKDGCCSCHINPPCSYCTTDNSFCPECDWNGEEEQREHEQYYKPSEEQMKQWEEQRKIDTEKSEKFYALFRSNNKIEKFETRRLSHTHFTMKIRQLYT